MRSFIIEYAFRHNYTMVCFYNFDLTLKRTIKI